MFSTTRNVAVYGLCNYQLKTSFFSLKWMRWTGYNIGKTEIPVLDVYVVEEHHEVLPYWFEAAKKKIIPKLGNTLIHIDGHSDMKIPYITPDYPDFRPPRNEKDIFALMQSNDAFIIGAVIAGLINRVIYIWPMWVEERSERKPYANAKIEIGVGHIRTKNKTEKVICACNTDLINDNDGFCVYDWVRDSYLENVDDYMNYIRPIKNCEIKKTFIYEIIREDVVYDMIIKGNWLKENENIILDIDEDYYGCTLAAQPLMNFITIQTIERINEALENLTCPKYQNHEKMADDLLVKVLNIFKKPNRCNISGKMDSQGVFPCKTDVRVKESINLLTKTLWSSRGSSLACSKRKGYLESSMIQNLIAVLKHLSTDQLQSLESTGFCLTSTLKLATESNGPLIQICHGSNIPGDSILFTHNPTRSEIKTRTKLLNKILHAMTPYRPKFTTVCRSVRDGYTPRNFFNTIERDIMMAVKKPFTPVRFNYDKGLLGGKTGWPDRLKSQQIKTMFI